MLDIDSRFCRRILTFSSDRIYITFFNEKIEILFPQGTQFLDKSYPWTWIFRIRMVKFQATESGIEKEFYNIFECRKQKNTNLIFDFPNLRFWNLIRELKKNLIKFPHSVSKQAPTSIPHLIFWGKSSFFILKSQISNFRPKLGSEKILTKIQNSAV